MKIDDGKKVQCQLCKAKLEFRGGSTSCMHNHMKNIHKTSTKCKDPESKTTLKQITMEEMNKSKAILGKVKYNQLNRALALAVSLDLRPLSMVNGRGFRYFCFLLNPVYKVPCAKTVKKNLHFLYEEAKEDIIKLIAHQDVSLTTDLWTGVGARSYFTLTAHFITPDWEFKSVVIATRPLDHSHTAKNIADAILAVKAEFKIHNLIGLTTDNASNMKLAGTLLGVTRQMCFSHGIQLAVQDGLKHVPIKKALAGASTLVGHFSKSALATTSLKEKQNPPDGEKPKCLIQSVQTRWNSEFFMARRLIELRIPVFSVLMEKHQQKHHQTLDLNDSAWTILEDIVPVLEPFADATEALTKENTPTLSGVFILLHTLVTAACKVYPEDTGAIKKLKNIICEGLKKRFDVNGDGIPNDLYSPPMVALFLDPRYKMMKFLSDDQKKGLTEYVAGLIPEAEGKDQSVTPTIKEEHGAATSGSTTGGKLNVLACLAGDVEIDLTSSSSSFDQEIEQYLAEPVRISDPLVWWRGNESRYVPML